MNDLDGQAVGAAVRELTDAGATAAEAVAEIGTAETADFLVRQALAEFGRPDILVSNAGILRDRVLWKMPDEDFGAVIRVHLRGTFTCARAVAAHMRGRDGGDRLSLWSHPQEVSVAFADGGWTAQAIADSWSSTVGAEPQKYGITIRELPVG